MQNKTKQNFFETIQQKISKQKFCKTKRKQNLKKETKQNIKKQKPNPDQKLG